VDIDHLIVPSSAARAFLALRLRRPLVPGALLSLCPLRGSQTVVPVVVVIVIVKIIIILGNDLFELIQ